MTQNQEKKKLFITSVILVIVYLSGFIGLHTNFKNSFLLLTPINLYLSAILLFANHNQRNLHFYFFCIFTFFFCFFVEVIGIKTGDIFGEYYYGNTLGLKFFDTPIIIGVNWLILIYSTGCICKKLKLNLILQSLIGATMLVLLDLFIEPVAMKFDFWNWNNDYIPVRNYVVWFAISFCLLLLFNKLKFNKNNNFAKILFIVQFVFFVLLNQF